MIYSGNCRLGDLFTSRREKGRPGLPTLSVTMNDGLVDRDELERKQETNLAPEEHLLVRPGDIAYNMMRMWQGAFGLAHQEAVVSPAYVVLRPKPSIDPSFASYLFKTKRMIHRFWAYSHGITDDRLRLYFDDFARIPASVPDLAVQKAISQKLLVWDKATTAVERIVHSTQIAHSILLNELSTGRRRLNGCRDSWKRKSLKQIGSTYGGLTNKSKDDFGTGKPYIPYKAIFARSRIDPNSVEFVRIGSDERQNSCRVGDIFFTGSSETPDELGMSSVLLDDLGEIYLNSFCIGFRLSSDSGVLPEFARFYFRSTHFRRSIGELAQGYTRFNLSKKDLLKLEILLPSNSDQRAIAEVLSRSENQIDSLKRQLAAIESERHAVAQKILGNQ